MLLHVVALVDFFLQEYFYQCMFFTVVCLVVIIFLAASVHKVKASRCFRFPAQWSCSVAGFYWYQATALLSNAAAAA